MKSNGKGNSNIFPKPYEMGLPGKFRFWRDNQVSAIQYFFESDKRIVLETLPTGSGKSLGYMAMAILSKGRVLVLTSTKALQNQLMTDFGKELDIDLVMGKSGYRCVQFPSYTCELAPCNFGHSCSNRNGCEYVVAIQNALGKKIVVANYAFWFSHKDNTLGNFDLLVCDEAHDISKQLGNALSVGFTSSEMDFLCGMDSILNGKILAWAVGNKKNLQALEVKTSKKYRLRFQRVGLKLDKLITSVNYGNECIVEQTENLLKIDMVSPEAMTEKLLYRGIEKVLLTSATLTIPLGSGKKETDCVQFPSSFPIENRIVTHIPTVWVDFRISETNKKIWISRIDQIISQRLDRKGIIHTVSYLRAKEILSYSEFQGIMISHTSTDIIEKIEEFKKSKPPKVLISPSVMTGFDFSDDDCRYQIIGKVPFPDRRSKVDRRRKELDRNYGMDQTMMSLVQMAGRGIRNEIDWCETFVIDNYFPKFIGNFKRYATKDFLDSIVMAKVIPRPREL